MPRRTPRSEGTRDRVASVAGDVIGEVGYTNASLLEIARRAGVTKATVYYHFDSKEDVYAAALIAIMREFDTAIECAIASAVSPAVALAAAVETMFHQMSGETRRYHPLPEPGLLRAEALAQVNDLRRQYERRLAAVVRAGQDAGEVMAGDPVAIARILITSVGRVARWFNPEGGMPATELIALLQGLFLNGALTDVGRRRLLAGTLIA
jgi:TetR/AcrR family transcriptional regulator, cholesterol catabolism regulator